jgi:hypothetical protein
MLKGEEFSIYRALDIAATIQSDLSTYVNRIKCSR